MAAGPSNLKFFDILSQTNNYFNSSNYFSTEHYLTFFNDDYSGNINQVLYISSFQNTLNFFSKDYFLLLQDFYVNPLIQEAYGYCFLAFNFSHPAYLFTNVPYISQYLFLNIKFFTETQYDIDYLRLVFPSFKNDLEVFEILSYDIDGSLYNTLSTPNTKLYYPEPFIASPSFAHEDIWILNILQYQHWLWFFFISLIMFYFITFMNVVRWCNQRNKPKRETRGVSRSKCADLITACVPVSWAASIIITESVDAADYYDGFGTGELVVGIRAYQWGWEYFYPKELDLNYTTNPNYSIFTGNSLKYTNSSSPALESNMLWKYYQKNSITSTSNTSTTSVLNDKNFVSHTDFTTHSVNTLETSNAFKKIQFFSKSQNQTMFAPVSNFNTQYQKLVNLYYTDTNLINSTNYGILRQHSFLSSMSNKNFINTDLDYVGLSKYFIYSFFQKKYLFEKNPLNISNYNQNLTFNNQLLLGFKTNFSSNNLKSVNKMLLPNERSVRFLNSIKHINNEKIQNSTIIPFNHNPIISNKNYFFDHSPTTQYNPLLLQSKEEGAPNIVFDTYWLSNWNFTNKISNQLITTFYNSLNKNYLSYIIDYSEYDFQNWQVFELVEDSSWEASHLSLNYGDYQSIFNNYKLKNTFSDQNILYNNLIRNFKFLTNKKLNNFPTKVGLPILSDEFISMFSLLNLNDFKQFQFENIIDTLEDNYVNMKLNNHLLSTGYQNLINTSTWLNLSNSYIHVFSNFTTVKEDNLWVQNKINPVSIYVIDLNSLNSNNFRLYNSVKLRSTVKNSIITYNAIQKVFKSRLDEGRSNSRLIDISNSFNTFLFLSTKRVAYEALLSKNNVNFFSTQNSVAYFKNNITVLTKLINSLNIFFTNLPFLVSTQSDAARYLWFDWQSRWLSLEVQPSSIARYSLLGSPYINKNFEYSTVIGDEINESENYLTRLGHSRKNYMTIWAYSPILYSRLLYWYQAETHNTILFNTNSVTQLKFFILFLQKVSHINNLIRLLPTYSLYNTPGREAIQSLTSFTNFDNNLNILSDLLSKREYLHSVLFYSKNNSSKLPLWSMSTPSNPLFLEIKKTFEFIDPVSFSSEISRNFFYQNIGTSQNSLNLFKVINNNFKLNTDLYKNQYRPMKKGITNMVRLQATGAIALPIKTRLHILASSKDVIHSWAIPSAGIKIDCVPGYSSHRVTIILNSGIYYGQCMEICGRFHHWMPIIAYFMNQDLFFIWVVHYLKSTTNYSLSGNTQVN